MPSVFNLDLINGTDIVASHRAYDTPFYLDRKSHNCKSKHRFFASPSHRATDHSICEGYTTSRRYNHRRFDGKPIPSPIPTPTLTTRTDFSSVGKIIMLLILQCVHDHDVHVAPYVKKDAKLKMALEKFVQRFSAVALIICIIVWDELKDQWK